MKLTTSSLNNVTELKLLSSTSTFGIGFLTSIVWSFCHLFGLECNMFNEKIEKAKNSAANRLILKANQAGADGIMGLRIQVTGLTVFMYGVAYKY